MLDTILVVMNSSPDFMNRFGGEVQVLWFFPPQVLPLSLLLWSQLMTNRQPRPCPGTKTNFKVEQQSLWPLPGPKTGGWCTILAQDANCGPPKRRLMHKRTFRQLPDPPAYLMEGKPGGSESK